MGTLFMGGGIVVGVLLAAFCLLGFLGGLLDREPHKPKDYHIRPNLEQFTDRD